MLGRGKRNIARRRNATSSPPAECKDGGAASDSAAELRQRKAKARRRAAGGGGVVSLAVRSSVLAADGDEFASAALAAGRAEVQSTSAGGPLSPAPRPALGTPPRGTPGIAGRRDGPPLLFGELRGPPRFERPPSDDERISSDPALRRQLGLVRRAACALCQHEFDPVCLSHFISFKAILEQRARWGLSIVKAASLVPATLYRECRLCVFCAQLFGMAHPCDTPALCDAECEDSSPYLRKNIAQRVRARVAAERALLREERQRARPASAASQRSALPAARRHPPSPQPRSDEAEAAAGDSHSSSTMPPLLPLATEQGASHTHEPPRKTGPRRTPQHHEPTAGDGTWLPHSLPSAHVCCGDVAVALRAVRDTHNRRNAKLLHAQKLRRAATPPVDIFGWATRRISASRASISTPKLA